MDRREFLHDAASKGAGILTLPLVNIPDFFKDVSMGIVVHSYGSRWHSKAGSQKYPGFADAIELIEHCHQIGAGGVQVGVKDWTLEFAKKARDRREKLGLYLEGSIGVPFQVADVPAFEKDLINAKEAGVVILRTVTSSGRRYEVMHTMEAVMDFKKNAMSALQLAEPILRKHKVKLAIENHKDWRADELVIALKLMNSEWIGVTLDFGNSISLMEDPMEVIEKLVPYVFTTHVKDMGVREYADGFLLSEVPMGKGILDLPKMIALCKKNNASVTFNLEMITRNPLEIPCLKAEYWKVFEGVPGSDLARTLSMVKNKSYETPLPQTSELSPEELLGAEEQNILECLSYSKNTLGLK